MWPFSDYTTAGRAALTYITIGAVTVIWAGIWYFYLFNNPPAETAYYWCTGFLVTGLSMILIGSVLGKISRSDRHAEQKPATVPTAVITVQPTAVPPPLPVPAPVNVTPPAVPSNGQAVLAPPPQPFVGTAGGNR